MRTAGTMLTVRWVCGKRGKFMSRKDGDGPLMHIRLMLLAVTALTSRGARTRETLDMNPN